VRARPVKVAAGQADGIQPRTLEVLDSYGLAEPLLKQGAYMIMAVRHTDSYIDRITPEPTTRAALAGVLQPRTRRRRHRGESRCQSVRNLCPY
jgi:hypothetical protein